jgi:hypothetical protein
LQRSDPDTAGQFTDYPFAGWVKTATDFDLAEMIGGNAFLTEMLVSIRDPSQITSDFTFARAPLDTEYRDVVYESTDVSGFVESAGIALAVIVASVVGLVLWRRRSSRRRLR